MPLGDILGATPDGRGGFQEAAVANQARTQQTAQALAPAAPAADPPDLTQRVSLVRAINPSLGNDPQALMTIARMSVPTEQLPALVLRGAGIPKLNEQVALLTSLTPDAQRQAWESMSAEGQQYWRNAGWNGGGQGGGGGFLGAVKGAVGKGIHGAGVGIGAVTGGLDTGWEAVKGIPVAGDVANYAIGKPVGYVAGGVGDAVGDIVHAYNKVAAVPSHLVRTGERLTEMTGDDPWYRLDRGVAAWLDVDKVADAWHQTADGERYIREENATKALDELGGDRDLYSVLLNLQAGDPLDEVVARKTGLTPGTQEFADVAQRVMLQANTPEARRAMKLIRQGKVSIGRDVARAVGLGDGSLEFNLTSGLVDGLFSWYSDPVMVAGKVAKAERIERYAMTNISDATRAARLQRFYGQTLSLDVGEDMVPRLTRVSRGDQSFLRANEWIAEQYKAGNTRAILDRWGHHAEMIDEMDRWSTRLSALRGGRGIETGDDITMFFMHADTRASIVSGRLLSLQAGVPTLPRITRTNQATEGFKHLIRGTIDLGEREAWLRTGAQISAGTRQIVNDLDPSVIAQLDAARASYMSMSARTRLARNVVGATVLSPMAGFMRAALTHVPRGAALDLATSKGTAEFYRILRLGGYGHLPPEIQATLFDGFVKGTIAERRNIYIQWLSDMATGLGLKNESVLRAIPKEQQRYSIRAHDMVNGLHSALEPIADTSTHIAIPSFRKMLAASTVSAWSSRTLARTAEGLPGYITSRIWSPLAVLRLAFIPRAVGDEMISYLLRFGPSPILKGWATPIAYDPGKLFDPAEFIARSVARVTPARLTTSSAFDQMGHWWEQLQQGVARMIERPLGRYVGDERLLGYALKEHDPLGKFPGLLAENPTVGTAFSRVSASGAYLEREFNPELDQVLQMTTDGPREGRTLIVPVTTSNRYETLQRDIELAEGTLIYSGGVVDAAILQSAPKHMNHKLSGPASRAAAEFSRGVIMDADLERLTAKLAPRRKTAQATREAGTKVIEDTADILRGLPHRSVADLKEALAVGEVNGVDALELLVERWAAEAGRLPVPPSAEAIAAGAAEAGPFRFSMRERRILVKRLQRLDARERQQILAWAERPGGLTRMSEEFYAEQLRATVRSALDSPELQAELLSMDTYADVRERIPRGHAQLYTVNVTPEELDALRQAHATLGDALFRARPDDSPRLVQALQDLRAGFDNPDLIRLQQRLVNDGLGSLPLSQWGAIDPEIVQRAMMRVRSTAIAESPEAAAVLEGGMHVGYNHVPVEDLRAFLRDTDGAAPALGAARFDERRRSWLLGNKNLASTRSYDASMSSRRTLEEIKDDHARRIANEFRDTFTGLTGARRSIHHEILNPAVEGGVEARHLTQMRDGFPTVTIRAEPELRAPNLWSRMVKFGYDEVVSPAIDAMIRQPIFLDQFAQAYRDAGYLRTALTNGDLVARAEGRAGVLGHDATEVRGWFDELPRFDPRHQTIDQWKIKAQRRIDNQRAQLETAIRDFGDQPDFYGISDRRSRRMKDAVKARLPRKGERLRGQVDRLDEIEASLGAMDPEDLELFSRWAEHVHGVESQLVGIASERAVGAMIPYIDDHKVRSQFQELMKPFIPFQFAQEAFFKRYGRTFLYNPDAVAKASLTFSALRDVGFLKKDQFGNDIYVLPGSEQFMDMMNRVAPTIFGYQAMVPVASAMTGSVQYSVPGFDINSRPFQFSPLVAVPVTALAQRFPELKSTQEKILGGQYSNQSVVDLVVPAHIRRMYQWATLDEDSKKFANVMTQAMAQLQSSGNGLPENATATQRDQFISRARNQARILLLTQAILGFITPATPQIAYEGDLHPEYQALLNSGLSIDEAVSTFLAAHPDATPYTVFTTKVPSKAPLATTHEALNYLVANDGFVRRYGRGAAWLMPQPKTGDGFYQTAYQQELAHGMRVLKTPEEWVNDVLYSEAAPTYYDSKRAYENRLAQIDPRDAATKRQVQQSFAAWKDAYLVMHPVFAEQLQMRGERAALERGQVRQELKLALADPDLPDSPQAAPLRQMLTSFERYQAAVDDLAGDTRAVTDQRRKDLKNSFANWGDGQARADPSIRAFWLRIIRPELGLREDEE